MKKLNFFSLQSVVNLPKPDFYDSTIPLSKLMIQSRQKRVNELNVEGYTNKEISEKLDCSLRTVEEDLHYMREFSRSWFENESIKDYCNSLHDSIILCDITIKNLQLLYSEHDDLDLKLKILSKIIEFEEQKTKLYEKSESVQNYLRGLQ